VKVANGNSNCNAIFYTDEVTYGGRRETCHFRREWRRARSEAGEVGEARGGGKGLPKRVENKR